MREALSCHQLNRGLIDLDPGQHLLVADAAARIGVRLHDELVDRQYAITDHMSRDSFGDGGDLAVDHQAAVVTSGDVGLDDDQSAAGLGLGDIEGTAYVGVAAQVEHDATTVVAVQWLQYDGVADPIREPDCIVDRTHRLRSRHR